MTETVSLTVKIDPALKETLKALSAENQTSISQEVSRRLQMSLETTQQPEVDSQHTPEESVEQLSAAELKQVRLLLKKGKRKK